MSGNVWEWCWNWFTYSYDAETEGGSDPTGPSSEPYRVRRGGGLCSESDRCAVSCRGTSAPNYRDDSIYGYGFRVVRQAN